MRGLTLQKDIRKFLLRNAQSADHTIRICIFMHDVAGTGLLILRTTYLMKKVVQVT
jgi:hypothetical protein